MNAHKNQASKIPSDQKEAKEERLSDEARFIRTWLENPRLAGAITPSGRFLARAMAHCVDRRGDGPIVELGPGTGPVTQALLARGFAPERLVLVEYEPSFCHLLAKKFPGVKVVRGDAYHLADTLAGHIARPPSAVVSSLPLLTKPESTRVALLRQAFALMGPEGRFVQFTYGVKSPVPIHLGESLNFKTHSLAPIWLNLPPARIFVYRPSESRQAFVRPPDALDMLRRQSRRFGREIRGEIEEARARLVMGGAKSRRP